jgi:acyl-coenzyme A thioesterase PaaI-like protein
VTAETGQTPWIQERDTVAERMLAGGGRPGIADPALRSGKTGLELLQAMLRGELRATASVVHRGRQLATAEGRIVGPDDRLYAHGTTTCLVFEAPTR